MSEPGAHEPQDLSPLVESTFAVDHGFVGASPDVVVVGPAVRRAREGAGLTTGDVALAMTRRGYPTDAAAVAAVEDGPAYRMRPRDARLLAAILDLPLAAIEATAAPWPAESVDVTSLRDTGVDTLVLGADVVVRTAAGNYLGLLRCSGDTESLASRTYRAVAATLLNGRWSHLAGALLVTQLPPHMALAVDALDCVTRPHAPSGLSGFSRLAEPVPLAEAVAVYDRSYSIGWSDPEPLSQLADSPAVSFTTTADVVADLRTQARRARQPAKREGYNRAADWLGALPLGDIADVLERAATEPALDVLGELERSR
jgi:hypothetical protein